VKSETVGVANATSKVSAALLVTLAVAETIHELGEVPAGHLYAHLMGKLTLEQFEKIVASLERSGLIKQTSGHTLKWVAPELPYTAERRGCR